MQLAFDLDDRRARLLAVDQALRGAFPLPRIIRRADPVTQLVRAILVRRARADVAFDALCSLRRQFGNWEAVRDAPVSEVAEAIRAVPFSACKARDLQGCFERIGSDVGRIALDPLGMMSVAEALAWLERLPGVGRAVSASVLNASTLRRPMLIVDADHLRVLKRMGLVGQRAKLAQAHGRIAPHLPLDWTAARLHDHHRRFKRLAQTVCRRDEPLCEACPVRANCRQDGQGRQEGKSGLANGAPSGSKRLFTAA